MTIVQNRKLYVAEYDLSGHLQGMSFESTVEMQDDTVFGDSARSNAPGLQGFSVQHEGLWDAGTGLPDDVLYANIGLADQLATLTPVAGTEGSLAYFMRTTQGSYQFGGPVGDLLRFSVSLESSGGAGAIRGYILGTGEKTSTGASAAKLQIGAVSSSQQVYAGLHVLSVSGTDPTLDVVVRSDANSSAGGETNRITFTQMTDVGSQWATPVAGAITDAYWDVTWTIGGTDTPTFDIVVVVGIK